MMQTTLSCHYSISRKIVIAPIRPKGAAANTRDLPPDMVERAKACKTPEEMLELAKEAGYELSDKEPNALSGGEFCWERSGKCQAGKRGVIRFR